MKTHTLAWAALAIVAGVVLSQTTTATRVTPRLEPIAETKLVMEGLAQANLRGIEKLLTQKPTDDQTWTFARGQALLLAETANLLMLRPPKNQGQAVWFDRAMEMRTQATILAQTVVKKDIDRSRAALVALANSCNRCHQAFRVPVQLAPFEDPMPPPTKAE